MFTTERYTDGKGYWMDQCFDAEGYELYSVDSNGFVQEYYYDVEGNLIRYQNNSGLNEWWGEMEYDEYGYQISFKNSEGNWHTTVYNDDYTVGVVTGPNGSHREEI